MNIGALEFEFLANVARLRQDMEEVKKAVGGATDYVSKAASGAKTALGLLAGGLSIAGFTAWMKAGIDAGDAMKAFSQKTGVAVEDVAGLQLAFKQGGVEGDKLTAAVGKMAKQMAEGSEGFEKLGVKTKNADGTLRSVKDVLYDTADAFAGMDDSSTKTALAVQVFGKSGMDLIPTLNEGSKGMREMAAMADKLGLSMTGEAADAADKFNDTVELLGLSFAGVGRQVAAQLLPTLNNLTGSMLEYITTGDTVKRISDGIATGMKLVYSAVLIVVAVFSTLGKVIASEVAQVMAKVSGLGDAVIKLFKGDFAGAVDSAKQGFKDAQNIGQIASDDIKQGWTQTANAVEKAWTQSNDKTVEGLAAVAAGGKKVTFQTKEQQKAVEDATKAYESWRNKLIEAGVELDAQIAGGEKLSAGQKQLALLTANNTAEVQKLTEKRRLELIEIAKANITKEEQVKHEEAVRKGYEESAKENDKYRESLEKSTQSIQAEVEKAREANATFNLTREATVALEQAKLEEQATAKDRLATWAEENMLGEDLVSEYKAQAEGLRELARLKGEKVHLEAAKEANEAWKRTTEEIGKSFTDSLFRAFEEGKSFGEAFMDSLKNLFKTTVLKLLIQPVQQGMNNMIGSFFGMGGSGGSSAGGSGGNGFGFLSNMAGSMGDRLMRFGNWMGEGSTIGGWANSAGSWLKGAGSTGGSMFGQTGAYFNTGSAAMGAGMGRGTFQAVGNLWGNGATSQAIGMGAGAAASFAGGFMAGRGVGQAISNGYSAIGGQSGNSAVNTGATIGAAVGSIIPGIGTMIGGLAGGALGGLVNRAFGHKAKEYNADKGIEGTIGGDSGLVQGKAWADWVQKGGWFRSDKHGTDTFDMDKQTAEALAAGTKSVRDQTKAWAESLGLPGERLDNITQTFRVKLTDNEAENQKVLAGVFAEYANTLANSFSDLVRPFQRAGESIADTMQRLSAMQAFSESLNQFGGIFSDIAGLSIEAKEQLVAFSGGIEAFVAKTQSFVDNYYTEAEKFGLQSKQLMEAFSALGLDASGFQTRADFRALVDAQDVQTEEGRKMVAALLDIAPAFTGVADYLTKAETTLGASAEQSPQIDALKSIFDQQAQTTATTEELVDGQDVANDYLSSIDARIAAGNEAIVTGLGTVADRIAQLNGSWEDWSSRGLTTVEP